MAIEHDFFGLLESGPDGSIFWSENVELGDQTVTVDLTAPDQDDVSEAALDVAAGLISAIEAIDRSARNAMVSELDDMLVDVSGDVHIDVIRSLQFMSMTILADEHGGSDPFAVLEYALDPDATDDVLLVNLGSDGDVLSVTSAD